MLDSPLLLFVVRETGKDRFEYLTSLTDRDVKHILSIAGHVADTSNQLTLVTGGVQLVVWREDVDKWVCLLANISFYTILLLYIDRIHKCIRLAVCLFYTHHMCVHVLGQYVCICSFFLQNFRLSIFYNCFVCCSGRQMLLIS